MTGLNLKEVERLAKTLKISMEEAYEVWVYDNEICTSDRKAKKYILETNQLPTELVEQMFDNTPKVKKDTVVSDQKYIKKIKREVLDYFVDSLTDTALFLNPSTDGNTVTYTSATTGKKVSVKFTANKHKKVSGHFVKRKDSPTPEQMQVEKIWDLVNYAVANGLIGLAEINGTTIGFKLDDKKFPYATLKITFHKK